MNYRLQAEIEETLKQEPAEKNTHSAMWDRNSCNTYAPDDWHQQHDWMQDDTERICSKCGRRELVHIPCPQCGEKTQRLYEVFSLNTVLFAGCYHCYMDYTTEVAEALKYYRAYKARKAKRDKKLLKTGTA